MLTVRAVDLSTGEPARGFTADFAPTRPWVRVADGEILRTRVRMPGGRPVSVSLRTPRSFQPVDEEALLLDGEEGTLTLSYRSKREVRGRVLGPDDRPVEGAFVWLGTQEEARLGDASLPFDARKVKGVIRTDYRGEFEVRGEGNRLSAWHEDWSPATIPISAPLPEIRLAARGSIRGLVVDSDGTPVAGEALLLDGGTGTRSQADGSFAFEKVEAGPRGLRVGKTRRVIVRVEPGRETVAEVSPGIHWVDVELRSGVDSWRGSLAPAVVVPLGPVGSIHRVLAGGNMIALRDVLPGPYLLMDEQGRQAVFEVSGRRAVADLGTAGLVIHGPPRTPLFVIPAAGRQDPLVESFARRMQRIHARDREPALVEPLPAGPVDVFAGEVGMSVSRARVLEPGKTFEVQFSPR
jgi:hypothetical protein